MRSFRKDTIRDKSTVEKLWDLTWGLVLVVGLTAISEFGVRMGYSKTAPDATVVSQPVMHVIK